MDLQLLELAAAAAAAAAVLDQLLSSSLDHLQSYAIVYAAVGWNAGQNAPHHLEELKFVSVQPFLGLLFVFSLSSSLLWFPLATSKPPLL